MTKNFSLPNILFPGRTNGAAAKSVKKSNVPRATALRVEPLEARELLDAASIADSPAPEFPPELVCVATLEEREIQTIDLSALKSGCSQEYALANAVSGNTLVVTSTADDGSSGTLRYMIENAQDGDTITFAPSLKGKTITLNGTQLEITKSITIDATDIWDDDAQAPGLTVSGANESRVFYVGANIETAFTGIVIADGKVTSYANENELDSGGAGVLLDGGTGVFNGCVFTGNNS